MDLQTVYLEVRVSLEANMCFADVNLGELNAITAQRVMEKKGEMDGNRGRRGPFLLKIFLIRLSQHTVFSDPTTNICPDIRALQVLEGKTSKFRLGKQM